MQKTLVVNGVVSKPFDFEALCLTDDAMVKLEKGAGVFSAYRACADAVSYLFEGTGVTDDVLKGLDFERLVAMYKKVYDWRVEAFDLLKNERRPPRAAEAGGLGIYTVLCTRLGGFCLTIRRVKAPAFYLICWHALRARRKPPPPLNSRRRLGCVSGAVIFVR